MIKSAPKEAEKYNEDCRNSCDKFRYMMGIANDENYIPNPLYKDLFNFHVKKSDWIVFILDFKKEFGMLWSKNPYKLVEELGYKFNSDLAIHIDVFSENFNGHMMEFWMPVE